MLTPRQRAAVMTDAPTQEQWRIILDIPQVDRPWLTDEETEIAAVVTARSLRTLQAEGLIRADKASVGKPGVGRRMWRRDMVYLAAVASELMRQFDWSIAKASTVLRLLLVQGDLKGTIQPLIFDALSKDEPDGPAAMLIRREDLDWFLSIHDGRFVFLKVPEDTRKILGAAHCEFPIGVISGEAVIRVMYELEDPAIFEGVAHQEGHAETARQHQEVEAIRAAFGHSRACIWLDLSMSVRAASRRMRGLEVRYIDDVAMNVLQANWADSLREKK